MTVRDRPAAQPVRPYLSSKRTMVVLPEVVAAWTAIITTVHHAGFSSRWRVPIGM
jgi:hypothetical protein